MVPQLARRGRAGCERAARLVMQQMLMQVLRKHSSARFSWLLYSVAAWYAFPGTFTAARQNQRYHFRRPGLGSRRPAGFMISWVCRYLLIMNRSKSTWVRIRGWASTRPRLARAMEAAYLVGQGCGSRVRQALG